MLQVCTCRIIFPATNNKRDKARPRVEIPHVKGVHIDKNFKNLTSTANVKLASRIYFKDREYSLTDMLKVGDPIELWLGYDNKLTQEFVGFIVTVNPRVPLELECEDSMYLLKKKAAHFVWPAGRKLVDLLKQMLPSEMEFEAADTEIGSLTANKSTVAKVLDKLKETYGLFAYFKGKKLIVGRAYVGATKSKASYDVEQGVIKNNLIYRFRADEPLKVVVKSYIGGDKIKELIVGSEDGEEHTCHVYGISEEKELNNIGNAFLDKLRKNGFSGNIETRGTPVIDITDVITVYGSRYPGLQNEQYFVDGIKVDFEGSYRRIIELGQRVL